MNGPPNAQDDGHGAVGPDGPDDLDRAYQRASERDPSRPGPQVRQAIMAQARSAVAAPGRRRAPSPAAANEARWHWRAAAGIAAVGLVGLLSWQFVRVAPPSLRAVQSPAVVRPEPAPAAVPEQDLMLQRSAAASVQAVAPREVAGAVPARTSALATAQVAMSGAPPGWPGRVLRAARELYPELFDAASAMTVHPPVRLTIALNADGSVFASSRVAGTRGLPEQRDAAALVEQAFALAAGSLTESAVLAPASDVTIVYGIRAPQGANATGAR
jgi:hypothetical protein